MAVVFLHIPKTAGTSVRHALRTHYGRTWIFPAIARRRDMVRLAVASRLHHFDMVTGHVNYGVGRLIPGEVRYCTFLRDPVARVVSEYHQVRASQPDPRRRPAVYNLGLPEHARAASQRNRQVSVLAGGTPDLDLARERASTVVVGVTERMGASMRRWADELGWDQVPEVDRLKVSAPRDPTEPEVLEEIASLNELDMALWREATVRLDGDG